MQSPIRRDSLIRHLCVAAFHLSMPKKTKAVADIINMYAAAAVRMLIANLTPVTSFLSRPVFQSKNGERSAPLIYYINHSYMMSLSDLHKAIKQLKAGI